MPIKPPEPKPSPADPLANPPAVPDLTQADLPVPLPNEPPTKPDGASGVILPQTGMDHPLGPPEPVERGFRPT